jgi:hypothetical protein
MACEMLMPLMHGNVCVVWWPAVLGVQGSSRAPFAMLCVRHFCWQALTLCPLTDWAVAFVITLPRGLIYC